MEQREKATLDRNIMATSNQGTFTSYQEHTGSAHTASDYSKAENSHTTTGYKSTENTGKVVNAQPHHMDYEYGTIPTGPEGPEIPYEPPYMGDQLGLAIAATLFCFWPIGIVAVIRASEARTMFESKDVFRAQILAKESRQMSFYALLVGIFIYVLAVIIIIICMTVPGGLVIWS